MIIMKIIIKIKEFVERRRRDWEFKKKMRKYEKEKAEARKRGIYI